MLAACLALSSADGAAVGSNALPLQRSLHFGATGLGLLVAVTTAVGVVATIPAGAAVDRLDRPRLLAGAAVVWAAASALSAASVDFGMLLASRALLGVMIAVAGPAALSLIGDVVPAERRSLTYGWVLSGELIGTGIGFVASGVLTSLLSWRWSFVFLAVFSAAVAVLVIRTLPEPRRTHAVDRRSTAPPPARTPQALIEEVRRRGLTPDESLCRRYRKDMTLWQAVRWVLTLPTNRSLILSSALGYFFLAGLRTFGVEYVQARYDVSQTVASVLIVGVGIGAVIGVLITGRVADHFLAAHRLAARPVVAGLVVLVAAVAVLPVLLTRWTILGAVFALVAAVGLGGTNPPLDAARIDITPARLRGRAEGIRTVLRSGFEAAAPVLLGVIATDLAVGRDELSSHAAGITRAFLIMTVPLLLSALLLLGPARRTYGRDVATALACDRHRQAADVTTPVGES